MKYLLDANAVLYLIRENIPLGENFYILDLTIYEIGNVMWKEAYIFKSISKKDVIDFMKNLPNVLRRVKILRIDNELPEIIELAIEKELTFYDASYLFFAKKHGLKLVTLDKKLFKASKEFLEVVEPGDIAKKFRRND